MTFNFEHTTLGEISGFIVGVSTLIGTLWGIGMWLVNRWVKRVESTVLICQKKYLEAMTQNINPTDYYTHDIHFMNGVSIVAPMLRSVELSMADGLLMSVVDHNDSETTLTVSTRDSSYLRQHYHKHSSEHLEVRSGYVTHLETGRIYRVGEVWTIEQEEIHSAIFSPGFFGFLVCRPPLTTAAERPMNLENMVKAFHDYPLVTRAEKHANAYP